MACIRRVQKLAQLYGTGRLEETVAGILGRPICSRWSEDAAAELASFVQERAALTEFPTWDAWKAAQTAWSAQIPRGTISPVKDDGVEQGFPSALAAGIRSK